MQARGSRADPRINSTGGSVGWGGRRSPRAGDRLSSPLVLTACQLTVSPAEARRGLKPAHPASPQKAALFPLSTLKSVISQAHWVGNLLGRASHTFHEVNPLYFYLC